MDALSPLGNNGPFSPEWLRRPRVVCTSLFLYFTSNNNSAPFCSHRRCSRMSSVLSSCAECAEIRVAYIIGDLGLPLAAFCPLTWEMLSPGGVIIINGIRWALLGRMRPRGWEGEVNEEELPCFDAGFFAMAAVAFLQLLHNIHWWWCFLGLQNILHSL